MEIKVRFKPDDVTRLDREAAAAGTSRAELIRSRALATGVVARLHTADYHRLVAGAAAFMHGDLPQRHVELLVSYVLNTLHRQTTTGRDPAA
jgi:hypothetical protein